MVGAAATLWRDPGRRAIAAVFLAALLIRLALLFGKGFTDDYREFARWAEGMAAFGPWTFYERFGRGGFGIAPNYPAFLYLLWPLGALFDGSALILVSKGLAIPFDLGIGALLYALIRRTAAHANALLGAALYLFAPPVLIAGSYWGQVDAAGTLPFLGSLAAVAARRYGWAGALAVLAGLVKPQFGLVAVAVGAVVIIELVRGRAWRPAAQAAAGGLLAYAAVALPLRLGPSQLLASWREQAENFPFTALYALNPWGVVFGTFKPDAPYVGLGAAFLLLGILAALIPLWRRRDLAALLGVGAFIAFAAYFLPTRVHERYLFPAVALLVPFAATRRRLLMPYLTFVALFAVGLLYVLWKATSVAGLRVPAFVERTLFTTEGQNAVAVALMVTSALIVWRLARGELSLVPSYAFATVVAGARLAAGRDLLERIVRAPGIPSTARWRRVTLALLLGVPTALNLVWLWPELVSTVPKVNDEVLHFIFVQRAWEALLRGENPFDFWVPEMELGFPEFYYYQHLPHLATMALHRLLLGLPDPYLFFNAVRYALLVAFPFTVFWSMRRLGFSWIASGVGASASSLIHTQPAFGLEYGSYLWRGYGLFTQLWGAHLFFITLALTQGAIWSGRGLRLAGLAFAALALSHLAYAYMMAITAVVLVLIGLRRDNARARAVNLALVGALTFALSAYMVVPFVLEPEFLQVSVHLPRFRWDGFGAPQVLSWLAGGALFDHGRLAVLTILVAVGLVIAVVQRDRMAVTAAVLFVVWLVLYFGRATLGPISDLFPFQNGLPVHRFLGAVHVAGILLIGVAGAWAWRAVGGLRPARASLLALVAVLTVLSPAYAERREYYLQNSAWMEESRAAVARDADARRIIDALRSLPPGRVFSGFPASWGGSLDFGIAFRSLRMYHLIAAAGLPLAAPPLYSWSLNSDLTWDFDERRQADYDLFNIRYVVAPRGLTLPEFLRPLGEAGPYRLYEAPTSGFAEQVAIAERRAVSRQERLYQQNREWARGAGPGEGRYIRYDYLSRTDASAPAGGRPCPEGRRPESESFAPARLVAVSRCSIPTTMLFKTTYHPNWRVTIDGAPAEAFMASPSYLAVDVPPGRHDVVAEYRAHELKAPLLALALLVLIGIVGWPWWARLVRWRR